MAVELWYKHLYILVDRAASPQVAGKIDLSALSVSRAPLKSPAKSSEIGLFISMYEKFLVEISKRSRGWGNSIVASVIAPTGIYFDISMGDGIPPHISTSIPTTRPCSLCPS